MTWNRKRMTVDMKSLVGVTGFEPATPTSRMPILDFANFLRELKNAHKSMNLIKLIYA